MLAATVFSRRRNEWQTACGPCITFEALVRFVINQRVHPGDGIVNVRDGASQRDRRGGKRPGCGEYWSHRLALVKC